jgi:hypothetical protein
MNDPWKNCPTSLFVDGLRCMAIETNYCRLRSLQRDMLFPGYLFQGTLFPVTPASSQAAKMRAMTRHILRGAYVTCACEPRNECH